MKNLIIKSIKKIGIIKKISSLFLVILFLFTLIPSSASAVWYNPIDWISAGWNWTSNAINTDKPQVGTTNNFNPSNANTTGSASGGGCTVSGNTNLKDIIMNFIIGCILVRSVYLIVAVAVVMFLYGVFKFIKSEGSDRQGGKELMFWGIVGLFVMISLWGLVAILRSTFQLS